MNSLLLTLVLPVLAAPQSDSQAPATQRDLVVETRGEGERVVGDVPFVLEYRSSSAPRDPVVVLRARTDMESGRAVLTDVVALRETHERLAGSGAKSLHWTLRIATGPRDQAERVVLTDAWPTTVRLNAMDLVALQVEVVDGAGAPAFEGGEIGVLAGRSRLDDPLRTPLKWARPYTVGRIERATRVVAGQARIWPVARETLVLAARLNGLSDWRLGRFWRRGSAGDVVHRLVVEPQTRVRRVRVFADGQPLSHATIAVVRREPSSPYLPSAVWDEAVDITTGEDGVAELAIDSAALFTLLFRASGPDGRERVATLELPGPEAGVASDAWEIGLAPPQIVRGSIVDPHGVPVAGARVNMTDGDSWVFNALEFPADDFGRFEFKFLRSDRWSFRFAADGFAPRVLELSTSEHDQEVVLMRTTDLSGYLRAADPQHVADLNLLLLRREHGVPLESAPGCSLGCSCDGRFEFKDLQPGRYTLIVRRASSGAAPIELLRRDEIEILGGQALDLGELRIE